MQEQERVAAFLDSHDLRTDTQARVLDLASEVGELAKDVNESSGYGAAPEDAAVTAGELGDAVFCLLALADETGIDAADALDEALTKYEDRLSRDDSPASGSHEDR